MSLPAYWLHPADRLDAVTDAVSVLVLEKGPHAVSIRAIARTARLGASTLIEHFTNRERLMGLVATRLGRRRLTAIVDRRYAEGVSAFLPLTDAQREAEVVWSIFRLLGSVDAAVGHPVAECRREEVALLGLALERDREGWRCPDEELDHMMALVDGLAAALCLPDIPPDPVPLASQQAPVVRMSPDRARELLTAATERLSHGPYE